MNTFCPNCQAKNSFATETRRQHALDVLEGKPRDPTQKKLVALGEQLLPIECVEDHEHPNMKGPDGKPVMMSGNADDVRTYCQNCGHIVGGWTRVTIPKGFDSATAAEVEKL